MDSEPKSASVQDFPKSQFDGRISRWLPLHAELNRQ